MSSPARAILTALVMVALSAVQLVAPPVAAADVTTLCKGYTGCAEKGMPDAGYARAGGSMYWRMYAGHNCTNYAAYRMVQSGMPNERPWDGGGNATYWGTSMAEITDDVPAVGSVAWWKAGVYPAGSAGHVAYVERVISPDTIVVSQDSWGGDFSWARITRSSRGWPSGFIHFNDVPLVNTTPPSVTGPAKVGATLTAAPGTWSPTPGYRYQWLAGGAELPGATAPTLTVGEGHLGLRIRVRVTASKPGYPTTTASSALTSRVLPGTLTTATAPTVSGDPVVDGALTATAGTWQPTPDAVTLQWLADGTPIQGADGEVLTPGPALVGRALSVRVTASRGGYDDVTVVSTATDPVRRAELAGVTDPVLSGTPRLGETLRLDVGSTAPEAVPTIQWVRGSDVVADASGSSYTLTEADLGKRVFGRVLWERPGYVEVRSTSTRTSPVKATPSVDVRVHPRRHRVRIRTDVVVPDGAVPPTQVWVRTGRSRQPVALVEGRAVTVLTGLRAGTRHLRVVVPPSRTVAASVWDGELTLP